MTERGNKMSIRIPPDFTIYLDPFIKTEMAKYGKNVAIANADHDYAKAWTAAFKPKWESMGGKVVAENPMSYNKATDFYSGVSKVLQGKPDVLFIGGASEPTALVAKQARDLGFKGGFLVLDQAKLDEMAKVVGGYGPLEGSVGVLPMIADPRPSAQLFVKNFHKVQPDRDPSSEMSLNYTAVHATAVAMKLANSVTDANAIRAQMDKAFKSLPTEHNPQEIEGVDEKGGSIANVFMGVVEGGKIKATSLRDASAAK